MPEVFSLLAAMTPRDVNSCHSYASGPNSAQCDPQAPIRTSRY